MHFPIAKLFGVLLRQISRPIAIAITSEAKKSPIFKRYICLPPAKAYNWLELKSKMWMLALGKAITIPVLNEQKMIELGASLLGELIVFSIGAGVVINELYKASQKEAKKEAGRRQEINQFKTELEDLYVQVQEQQALIQKIIRLQGNNGGEGGVSKRMEDEVLVQTMKLETAISTFLKRLLFK